MKEKVDGDEDDYARDIYNGETDPTKNLLDLSALKFNPLRLSEAKF